MSKKSSKAKSEKESGVFDRPDGDPEVKPELSEEAEGGSEAMTEESKPKSSGLPEASGGYGSVMVMSLWPSRLILRGAPSGSEYVWDAAGESQAVLEEDLPYLAEQNRKITGCCGSSGGKRRYFDL